MFDVALRDGSAPPILHAFFQRALGDGVESWDLDQELGMRRDAERLRSAITGLPGGLREVLELFYFEAVHTVEIAERLGLPHVTVRTRLHRARLSLRRTIARAQRCERRH